jgi:L-alanine-DL-glutamate epimerase-like enolase superfamily enzyme
MRDQARQEAHRPLLKVKLGGSADEEARRIHAVREGAQNSKLVADVNGGWTLEQLIALAPVLSEQGYRLIEQPLPRGQEALLDGVNLPLPLCLDESICNLEELHRFGRLCDFVNIKIDKAGGLTHALQIAAAARQMGLGVFVGCMISGTLAIAPAMLLAQGADYVDLDGPLWLLDDEEQLVLDAAGRIEPIAGAVWG